MDVDGCQIFKKCYLNNVRYKKEDVRLILNIVADPEGSERTGKQRLRCVVPTMPRSPTICSI